MLRSSILFIFCLGGLFFLPDSILALEQNISKDEKKAARVQERERVKQVFEEIYLQDRTVKKSPEWLKDAYRSLKIRRLNDIPKEEAAGYKKYLYDGDVYIVVHPGFFPFFIERKVLSSPEDSRVLPAKDIMERFSDSIAAHEKTLTVYLEQERLIKDFVQFMSVEKKLVILVLPGDYRNHLAYGYVPGVDEYMRFINEITNGSESVVYLESASWGEGSLDKNNLDVLTGFLSAIEVKNIVIGGGYIGKCLDDFTKCLRKKIDLNNIYFAPEIVTISPLEMVLDKVALLKDNHKINFKDIVKYINIVTWVGFDNPEEHPHFKKLPMYNSYR